MARDLSCLDGDEAVADKTGFANPEGGFAGEEPKRLLIQAARRKEASPDAAGSQRDDLGM